MPTRPLKSHPSCVVKVLGVTKQDLFVPVLTYVFGEAEPGGSQFFITHVPTPHLNGKHTVFGAVMSDEDQKVVNSIAKGDKIVKMVVTGDTGPLFEKEKDRIAAWNKTLEARKK